MFAECGTAVARIHEITFDSFGDLDPSATIRDGSTYVDALRRRAAQRIPKYLGLFESLMQKHRAVLEEVAPARLTHEDLNPNNLLVAHTGQTWHLAGVLDFDSAWSGNAESDLARLELWRGMMHPSFWTTYGGVSPTYASRRALLQLLWCLDYAQPTPDHNAVTAGVCAELGIPPVIFA